MQPGGDLPVQLPDIGVGFYRDIRFIGKTFPGLGEKSELFRGQEGEQDVEGQMRLRGDIGQDAGDDAVAAVVQAQDFPHRIVRPEIFRRRRFGQHDGPGVGQRASHRTLTQGKREHLEKFGIDQRDTVFVKPLLAVRHDLLIHIQMTRGLMDLGEFRLQGRAQVGRQDGDGLVSPGRFGDLRHHAVNGRGVGMKPIVAQLILHPKENHQATAQTRRQPEDVDE